MKLRVTIRAIGALLGFLSCVYVLIGMIGRRGGVHTSDVSALRRQFPEHASKVLRGHAPFVVGAEGFETGASMDLGKTIKYDELRGSDLAADQPRRGKPRGGLWARLPTRGEEPVRFDLPDGTALSVQELGLMGEGLLAEDAVVYARPGGASYWVATEEGYEEWLRLDADRRAGEGPAAVWEVKGGVPEQHGDAIEIADASGEAKMRVTAPAAYALGGRSVVTRLTARHSRIELWVEADGETVLVDPGWRALDHTMKVARSKHTTTVVRDIHDHERVLAVGGTVKGSEIADVEWLDVNSGEWTALPPLKNARVRHTATLLSDGRVLVAGGLEKGEALATVELFDPKTETWSQGQPMKGARFDHTAIALKSPFGEDVVLVAGGDGAGTAEIFDPSTSSWMTVGSMSLPRSQHTATLLDDGRVIVAGGAVAGIEVADVEWFSLKSGDWAPLSPMVGARAGHTATLINGGGIVVAGGIQEGHALASVDFFDPSSNTWISAPQMTSPRAEHTATLLHDGRVLVAGGTASHESPALGSAEIFDAITCWTLIAPLRTARQSHSATLLGDGRVLMIGGNRGTYDSLDVDGVDLFSLNFQGWAQGPPMNAPRVNHATTMLQDGRILMTGGGRLTITRQFPVEAYGANSAEIFDPLLQQWELAPPMGSVRFGHSATTLLDGRVLIAGGCGSDDEMNLMALNTAEVFDPTSQAWAPTNANMSHKREGHTATLLPDGRVFVVGGFDEDAITFDDAELFDPYGETWVKSKESMSAAREGHTATLMSDGHVLVVGGTSPGHGPIGSAEMFNPVTETWTLMEPMKDARAGHTATLLAGGVVLVTGGRGANGTLTSAELYDSATGKWMDADDMTTSRFGHNATLLLNGLVLVTGGAIDYIGGKLVQATLTSTCELFDPATRTWTVAPPLLSPRLGHFAGLVGNDGAVLVAGGFGGDELHRDVLDSSEIFGLDPNGTSCLSSVSCQSGICVDGVCCDRDCNGGACEACSTQRGAAVDGTCAPLRQDCSPFTCVPETGECASPCESVRDCVAGFVCTEAGSCVEPPPNASYRSQDGCDLSGPLTTDSTPPRIPTEVGLMLVATLVTLRRRASDKSRTLPSEKGR